jgi:endonuclease/exonuclease/phosphatase family metal-dependent hydrolase
MVMALTACGDDDDDDRGRPYQDDGKLTVMTRNLYLGADLGGVIEAATIVDPAEQAAAFVAAATQLWADVQANDFRLRAAALADEISAAEPDLVGLQEAMLWRIQSPSDAITGGTTPATQEAFNYLNLLLAELDARGLTYVVANELELFDFEAPVQVGTALQDVRLTDRQVILAREGVPISAVDAAVFQALVPLPVPGEAIPVKRGWTKVTARIGAEDVTVYNTHLESFEQLPRAAQAVELALTLADESGRVVLLGDLNSEPGTAGDSYEILTAADMFSDVWATIGTGDGFTCCFAPLLSEPRTTRDLDQRIDHVLWRGDLAPESVDVVGDEDADRTASGLWPSDHAGVVATFTLSP